MADAKISQLTSATTPLAGTEVLPVVQSGTTKQVAVSNLTAGCAVSAASLTLTGDLTVDTTTLKVDSTNNRVGIGTASPTFPLEVYSSGGASLGVTAGTGKVFLYADNTATTLGVISAIPLRFYINGSELARIAAAGDVTVNTGNLVIGTAGKGIDFSADSHAAGMTSELLDDYEEGTWTPALNGTSTYSALGGTYTKIGRTVNFRATILVDTIGTGSTTTISGLPYTSTGGISGCSVGYFTNSATLVSSLMPRVPSSGTTIIMSGVTVAAASITTPLTFFQNGTYLEISGTYQAS